MNGAVLIHSLTAPCPSNNLASAAKNPPTLPAAVVSPLRDCLSLLALAPIPLCAATVPLFLLPPVMALVAAVVVVLLPCPIAAAAAAVGLVGGAFAVLVKVLATLCGPLIGLKAAPGFGDDADPCDERNPPSGGTLRRYSMVESVWSLMLPVGV
jgi:hypothetical protein